MDDLPPINLAEGIGCMAMGIVCMVVLVFVWVGCPS